MVLSRIIISALLAFGSITVALPVVPGDVTGTTPTPGSGAPLPHLQGSLAVGDGVPLQDGMKGVSLLVGGPSSPHGNAAGSSISRRQGQGSSADGRSSNVPSPEQLGNHLPSCENCRLREYINRRVYRSKIFSFTPRNSQLTLYYDKGLRQKMDMIRKYHGLHENYKAIVDRLSSNMEKAPETLDDDDYLDIIKDREAVTTLASVIELYMPPNKGDQSSPLFHLQYPMLTEI
ncbi:uncharacterized protein C8R40DRAFT_1164771 [Lentinula edodes]|uniref:uncharacterized protein n=1 Tax=Lentinula edodes TaxID=5353 RepID=UPI001E8E541F|nr:uncharacterized protein C8R40DRAFT_1164771 [Lentinula edodes]KAH7881358.1 hypothetical protein C8R40DRAFT_1164771 [Lentinula edodes]